MVTASGLSGTSFRKTPCVSGRCPVRSDARMGEQTGMPETALTKLDALALEPVEVRRLNVRVARVAECLRPPLVGEDKEDVRRASARSRRSVGLAWAAPAAKTSAT